MSTSEAARAEGLAMDVALQRRACNNDQIHDNGAAWPAEACNYSLLAVSVVSRIGTNLAVTDVTLGGSGELRWSKKALPKFSEGHRCA
jgi:hypothetical protein